MGKPPLNAADKQHGPYPDRNGAELQLYDYVTLVEATEIEMSAGEARVVPAGTVATLLLFVPVQEGVTVAYLEVYPNDNEFGFIQVETSKIIFQRKATEKLSG